MILRQAAPLAAAALLLPRIALAHGAEGAAGNAFFHAMSHGISAALSTPVSLLPMLALGLLLAMQGPKALSDALPAMLAGLGAGLLLPDGADGPLTLAALGLALLLALLLALAPALAARSLPRWAMLALTLGSSLAAIAGLLHGHAGQGTPLPESLAALLVLPAITAASFLAARLALSGPQPWRLTALRIAASWLAAITLMVLALALAPA